MTILFALQAGPALRFLQVVLLLAVMCLFIGRLVMISAYQQRTSDYFDIRLMVWYPMPETAQALGRSRVKIIGLANLLAKIMWGCGILLFLLCVFDPFFCSK